MNVKVWHIALFALIVVGAAAALHPTHLRIGSMLTESGMASQAIDRLMEIYQKDPDNARAIAVLAAALEQMGDVEHSQQMYERLVQLKPRDRNFEQLARFSMGINDPAAARQAYQGWFDYRLKSNGSFSDDLGRDIIDTLYALCLQTKDFACALRLAQKRKELNPTFAGIIDNDMITLYEMSGDLQGTLAQIERTLEADSSNEYALDKYLMLAPLGGRKQDAEQYLALLIRKRPGDEKLLQKRINFETRLKDYDAANRYYREWLASAPGDRALEKRYVDWLLATMQQQRAIAWLEGLPPEQRGAGFQDLLVQLYEWNGMKEKLVEPYRERWQRDPSDVAQTRDFIWLLLSLKRRDEAEAVLRKMTELYPGNREYMETLVSFYQEDHRRDDSIALLEKAVQKREDPKLLKQLGELYLARSREP